LPYETSTALDIFIWYSLFQKDGVDAGNYAIASDGSYAAWAGGFHVFNSIFENSAVDDISIGNTTYFKFRNNYSIGSNQFIFAIGSSNIANITVEGNTILDTSSSTSIDVTDLGPVILLDNTIRSKAGVTSGPVVNMANWEPSDLFSMEHLHRFVADLCERTLPFCRGSGRRSQHDQSSGA
jgi:hypothetical protein